ncbi:MAG: polymer-forming cytoskeletal protein [Anaerolineae bacterium]|nr:polymer-forming cytoskeletal protein [Anaerolineae bacterium]
MFRELLGDSKKKKAETPVQTKSAPVAPVIDTVLGTGARFEGNLKTEGNVRIHGTFVGNITSQAKVAVGEHGKLEGDLTGEAADIGGQVRGNILARRVAVARTGRIGGDLRLEKLVTEEGAFIQGVVTMEEKVELPDVPKPPAVIAEKQSPVPAEKGSSQPDVQAKAPPAPSVASKQKPVPKPGAKNEPAVSSKDSGDG